MLYSRDGERDAADDVMKTKAKRNRRGTKPAAKAGNDVSGSSEQR
jgi:hypothetical protein